MDEQVAFRNILFTCEVGSTAHGISMGGQDDLDLMSVYLEEPDYLLGLEKADTVVNRTQPEGVRSGPGDRDWVLHPLQKWMGLALKGNPTILMALFAPLRGRYDGAFVIALRANTHRFVSRDAGNAFLGYLVSQKVRLEEGRSMRVNRPELIEQYGYDVKYAAHALRLGLQGVEFMTHGSIAQPMESPHLELVRSVRTGEVGKHDAIRLIEEAEYKLLDVMEAGNFADHADREWANSFLRHAYLLNWMDESGGYQ